jgi:hypothetical protein
MKGDIELIRTNLHQIYRRNKRSLNSIEAKLIQTPTTELELEAAEARGVLKGILKALDSLEKRANSNEFPELFSAV